MELPMADYIVCHSKRNSPRLNVRICQEKCPLKDECKEYLSYLKASAEKKQALALMENMPVVALSAP
jgi:hypothetical protein